MTKSRIFLYAMLFFICGIAVRSFIHIPYILLLFGFIVCAILAIRSISQHTFNLFYYSLFIFCLIFGIFRFDQVTRIWIDPKIFGIHTFEGVVTEEPELHAQSQDINITLYQVDQEAYLYTRQILVTTRKYPEYSIGDKIRFSGMLIKPENFGEFDYVSYLQRKNIFGIISFPTIEKIGEEKHSFKVFLFRIKNNFDRKIDLLFRQPHGALLKGLLLGERSMLPQEFLDALKETGTTHIVALSGYNITIVGKYILIFLLFLLIPFRIAFWMACVFIVLFVMVTGASSSAVRAGIMGILVLLAQNEGRLYRMTNALVFAATIMVYINPLILRFDTGFQLSFLATCGILYLPSYVEFYMNRISQIIHKKRKILAGKKEQLAIAASLRTTLIETLSAQIFVLPWLLYIFGKISLISPLVNIIVLPAVPYAMGWGFFAVLAGFIFIPMARVIALIGWLLLTYVFLVIEWFAKVPLASLSISNIPWYVPLVLYVALGLFLRKQRKTSVEKPRSTA